MFKQLISSNTGVSHKRYIAVIFSFVVIIGFFLLMFVEIPENNESIINQIVYLFVTVIVYQSGASVYEKVKQIDKKENPNS